MATFVVCIARKKRPLARPVDPEDGTLAKAVWDKHSIKAEVHRRGETMTSLAHKAGVTPNLCRVALMRPSPLGEAIIADFLGGDRSVLWPSRQIPSGSKRTPRGRGKSRQITTVRADESGVKDAQSVRTF